MLSTSVTYQSPTVKKHIQKYAGTPDRELMTDFYELRQLARSGKGRRKFQKELEAVTLLCLQRGLLKIFRVTGRFDRTRWPEKTFTTELAAPDADTALDWCYAGTMHEKNSMAAAELEVPA